MGDGEHRYNLVEVTHGKNNSNDKIKIKIDIAIGYTPTSEGERLDRAALSRARFGSGSKVGAEDTKRRHGQVHEGLATRTAHSQSRRLKKVHE